MPLHLLGKKSWNVYNSDNIERVRRDEAAAKEREHAEEQRLQEIDAERRLAILRGEEPPALLPSEKEHDPAQQHEHGHRHRDGDRGRDATGAEYGRERKKRKRHGEDDTDFEMRVARERSFGTSQSASRPHAEDSSQAIVPHKSSNAPLTDASGHIDLFGGPDSSVSDTRKNPEAEAEKARKKREYEDQYRMRFSNAAGFKASASGPWYAPSSVSVQRGGDKEVQEDDGDGKDAFGRPDPGRKNRDAARVEANDPLAMMKRGAAKARKVEKERKAANEEREREIKRIRREERRREKRRRVDGRSREEDSDDALEGFSLDRPERSREETRKHHHDKDEKRRDRHHHHRHRSPHRSSRGDERRRDHDR